MLIFSRLRDLVYSFRPVLLKLAQISCIIIDINPIENKETPLNIMGKGTISNLGYFFSLVYAIKSTLFIQFF